MCAVSDKRRITVMAGKLSENWQDGKTLQECNLHLMEMEYSDITFRLYYKGEDEQEEVADIPALRLLCLARSPVFFAMFNGKLAQHPDNRVHEIRDDCADPQAFKQMIRFMYSDDVVLTADNVLAILYLSQKYMVSTLTKRCLQFLEESLTLDTAPILLEQSILYEEKELKEKTLATIVDEAPAVLASDEFLTISQETLSEILKLELKVDNEVTVFEACMKWAKNQCQKLKKSPSGENIREVLGKNLYLIRFPMMSLSEFSEKVAPLNVLTSEEGYDVFRYITSESNKPENLPFHTEQRVKMDPNPRSLIVPAPYSQDQDYLEAGQVHHTSLSCTISKRLILRKICVHAFSSSYQTFSYPFRKSIQHELTVTLTQNGQRIHEYTGRPSRITGQLPGHYAVDVDDVLVESGALELYIELKLRNTNPWGKIQFTMQKSSPATSQLSDDFVTITFPPNNMNLLLGIEYRIP